VVRRASKELRLRHGFQLRTYPARQLRRLLASVSLLEVYETYDFRYDIGHPFARFAELSVFASPSALRPYRPSSAYVGIPPIAVHYKLEKVCKTEIVRKLKQRFGAKTIRDIRFRVG